MSLFFSSTLSIAFILSGANCQTCPGAGALLGGDGGGSGALTGILDTLGIGDKLGGLTDIFGGGLPKLGGGAANSKKIEDITAGLRGPKKTGDSCIVDNAGKVSSLPITPSTIRNLLNVCENTILKQKVMGSGDKCVYEVPFSAAEDRNPWAIRSYRHITLKASTSDGRSEADDYDCGDYLNNLVAVQSNRQMCLEARGLLEKRGCEGCHLLALSQSKPRKAYLECMKENINGKSSSAEIRTYSGRCLCAVSNDKKLVRQNQCECVGLRLFDETDLLRENLGSCLSINFGKGKSCLSDSKLGNAGSRTAGQETRNLLLECEYSTLRYRVDNRDGCVYKIGGYSSAGVWGGNKKTQLTATFSADLKADGPVEEDAYGCEPNKGSFSSNLKILEARKNMCEVAKSIAIDAKCSTREACTLKALVDSEKRRQRIADCLVREVQVVTTAAVERCAGDQVRTRYTASNCLIP